MLEFDKGFQSLGLQSCQPYTLGYLGLPHYLYPQVS